MLKLIGSSIVFICAAYVGMNKYQELYKRKRLLTQIRDGSVKIRDNLRCMCMPLYECFLSSGDFFCRAADIMQKGLLPADAIKEVIKSEYSLTVSDRESIYRFAEGLCAGDCKGQLANIEMFISELDRGILHAEKELCTKGALFVKGSLLAAAAIVLLMI